jgi:hypothetical protein
MTVGLLVGTAHAGLSVRELGQITPQDLAQVLVGGGVQVFNVTYTGATNASGAFCGGSGIIGFMDGIVLTSGDAANVIGPNNSSGKTGDNGLPGDADLTALIPGYTTYDASVLEFDFVAVGTNVQFNYVFASEEYNDFVNSSYNDVFGFFVNGTNRALIPGTTTPVSINNINNGYHNPSGMATGPCWNCQFFIDNTGTPSARNTQMDGLTTVLTMTAPVNAGQTNHMKIAIADAGDHVLDSAVFIQARSLASPSTQCITRDARFWFTHAESADPNCVTLKAGIEKLMGQCDTMSLGFLNLPVGYRDGDNIKGPEDAFIEALGLYWKSNKVTGEDFGRQTQKLRASVLCRARKQLAVELLAALGNVQVLQTLPANCTYVNSNSVLTNFPSDLLDQADVVLARENVTGILDMTDLLRKFNSSGVTNDFPLGYYECTAGLRRTLKKIARDPTTRESCPGRNDSCETAEAITGITYISPFKRSVNTSTYGQSSVAVTNGVSGHLVWYKITPDVGPSGRHFTANTAGSNFDTMLTVWQGTCYSLSVVTNNDNDGVSLQSRVQFSTDGTNTYYIVVSGGGSGGYGRAKIKVTSP